MATVKRLPVHHHSADHILSGPMGVIWLLPSQFENRVPLKPVQGGVGSVALYITAHEQLVMSMMVSFCAVLFPTRCLG